jgi:uncharacterized protein
MRVIDIPLLHCYRCGNCWTPRARVVRICPRCKSPYWEEPRIRILKGGGGLGIDDILGPHRERIAQLARRHHLREIRAFGSVARGNATPTSDVDILVDKSRSIPTSGHSDLDGFASELGRLLGRHVDVATESSLHWYVQPQVVAEAIPL